MPLFLTLRDNEGTPLASAMLPSVKACGTLRPTIVGPAYATPMRRKTRPSRRWRRQSAWLCGANATTRAKLVILRPLS